jgi:uncharacterized coiled-coil DUF342 family protein
MSDEQSEWFTKIEEEKNKRLEEYDKKINDVINEINEMRCQVVKLLTEKETFKKQIEEYVNKLMEQWIVEKK